MAALLRDFLVALVAVLVVAAAIVASPGAAAASAAGSEASTSAASSSVFGECPWAHQQQWQAAAEAVLRTRPELQAAYAASPESPAFRVPPLDCANVTVPLDYAAPGNGSVQAFASRFAAPQQPARAQLWILNGGPGDPGEQLAAFLSLALRMLLPDVDLIYPDHRGVGYSTPLQCPHAQRPQGNVTNQCLQYLAEEWGAGLHQFSTSNAARDVLQLMAAANNGGGAAAPEVYVYGVSYGTWWLQRLLQLAPAAGQTLAAVALDGIVPPDAGRILEYDANSQQVGFDLLTTCSRESETCAGVFGGGVLSPGEAMQQLVGEALQNNVSCLQKLSIYPPQGASLQRMLAAGMDSLLANYNQRLLVAPLVFRLQRCNNADIAALQHFFSILYPYGPDAAAAAPASPPLIAAPFASAQVECSPSYYAPCISLLLQYNVVLGELLQYAGKPLPSLAAINAAENAMAFTIGLAQEMVALWPRWNRYQPDQYWNLYPTADDLNGLPMLLLNGDLDPQTPFWWASHAALTYSNLTPHATFVHIPYSPHATILFSNNTLSPFPCSMLVLASFITSPTHTANTTCVDYIVPPDWDSATPQGKWVANSFFGVDDLWQVFSD